MDTRVQIAGASGRSYSFFVLDATTPLQPIGVTYLIAERSGNGWRLLQVGETSNFAQREWEPRLEAVRRTHGAAELLFRLNVSRRIREEEAADIVAVTRTGGSD